jgi:mannose-6-phosphate isomerase-like protein (cupin superfamily)
MVRAGDVLDLGPLGTRFHIKKTAAETDGRSFEMEWEIGPRTGGTPIHIHPHASESYEVLQGEFDVYLDGEWRTLLAGERVVVNSGVPHTFRNSTDAPVRVHNTHAPAMRFGEYFEGLHRLANSGAISPEGINPRAILSLSVLMTSFKDEIRSVSPPYAVVKMFALFGKLLGYRI